MPKQGSCPRFTDLAEGQKLSSKLAKAISPSIHHIVLSVRNLKAAIRQFEQLGFTVTPGGKHSTGFSENALVYLTDGTFLELFSLRRNLRGYVGRLGILMGKANAWKDDPAKQAFWRFSNLLREGPGWHELALSSPDLHFFLERLRDKIPMGQSHFFYRVTPQGERISWHMACPMDDRLPFLMGNYSPPLVLEEGQTRHANGALGVQRVTMATTDWDQAFQTYATLLDANPEIGRWEGEPVATFRLDGQQELCLLATDQPDQAGLRELHLRAKIDEPSHLLPPSQTGGLLLRLNRVAGQAG